MRSYAVAVVLALTCAGGAGGCFWRAHTLRADAAWTMARANAQADEYVSSFDGAAAERELAFFGERRQILEREQLWQRAAELFVMVAVLLLFAAYGMRVAGTVRPVGSDGRELDEPTAAPSPVPVGSIAR